MYKIGEIGGLYLSMPPNMQNVETEAFCYAIEKQMSRLVKLARRLNVWGDLDHVDPKHYDYIASCLRTLYFRSDMTDDQKLAIIKSSMLTYRYAGTVKAIEELLGNLFDEAEFIPWYEYGGRPYHFKIRIIGRQEEDKKRTFESILKKVKAARSVADDIKIEDKVNVDGKIHYGHSMDTIETIEIM